MMSDTAPEASAPEAGAPEVDAPKVDIPKVNASEVSALEVDAPDTTQAAASHEQRVSDRPAALPDVALDKVFREARTPLSWAETDIDEDVLHALYGLVKLGPTSGNCSPARFVFLRHRDNRERLRDALSSGNVERTLSAPVTVIVAHDPHFYEQLPRLYPQAEARSWFAADPVFAEETAFRNSTLQGGYLILAARMLGLDAAPMSGFDNAKVDEIFLDGQGWRSNFLVSLGYANRSTETSRAPRLAFDEACLLL